jgi:predicted small integral membrane protein
MRIFECLTVHGKPPNHILRLLWNTLIGDLLIGSATVKQNKSCYLATCYVLDCGTIIAFRIHGIMFYDNTREIYIIFLTQPLLRWIICYHMNGNIQFIKHVLQFRLNIFPYLLRSYVPVIDETVNYSLLHLKHMIST